MKDVIAESAMQDHLRPTCGLRRKTKACVLTLRIGGGIASARTPRLHMPRKSAQISLFAGRYAQIVPTGATFQMVFVLLHVSGRNDNFLTNAGVSFCHRDVDRLCA